MNCKNCGNILENGATFCSKCGAQVVIENVNQNMGNQNQFNVAPPTNNQNVNQFNSSMQQNYKGGISYNVNPQNNPKNKNTLFIIIIIICVTVILGLGAFIAIKLLPTSTPTVNETPNNKKEDTNQNEENNKSETNTNENVSNTGTNDNSNKKTIYNYTFTLPSYLKYNNGTDYIYAANSDISMIFNFYVSNYTYEDVLNNFDSFSQSLEQAGAIVEKAVEGTYEGRNYILATLNVNGYYVFYYITKLDNSHVVEGMIQGTTEEHFTSAIKAIDELLDSVETTNSFANDEPEKFKSVVGYQKELIFE